jgi:hypothetical protein
VSTGIVILIALLSVVGWCAPATAEWQEMDELRATMFGTVTGISAEEKGYTIELRAGYRFKYLLLVTDNARISSGKNGGAIALTSIRKGDSVEATCRHRTIDMITAYSSWQAGDRSGVKYPMGSITCPDTDRITVWND